LADSASAKLSMSDSYKIKGKKFKYSLLQVADSFSFGSLEIGDEISSVLWSWNSGEGH